MVGFRWRDLIQNDINHRTRTVTFCHNEEEKAETTTENGQQKSTITSNNIAR